MIKEYKTRASNSGTGSAWATREIVHLENQHVPLSPQLIHDLDQILSPAQL